MDALVTPTQNTTVETILKGLEITEDEFRLALGGQYARAVTRRLKRNTK